MRLLRISVIEFISRELKPFQMFSQAEAFPG